MCLQLGAGIRDAAPGEIEKDMPFAIHIYYFKCFSDVINLQKTSCILWQMCLQLGASISDVAAVEIEKDIWRGYFFLCVSEYINILCSTGGN